MLYLQYERLKMKYLEAQRVYDSILTEKESLFQRTQPQGISTDKEKVTGGKQGNAFDEYLIEKERKGIDERLSEAQTILDDRESLLDQKEAELRKSKRIEDELYVFRYLDRMKVRKIARLTSYSEPQVYRVLKRIREKIEDDRK